MQTAALLVQRGSMRSAQSTRGVGAGPVAAAQIPGESLASGTARMNSIAENVLPQVRRELDR
ncbi:MAG TPA: hypothetical protein EYQ54_01950 [Myxococcales bacterium]|nr:hypothetical protein [Myxococcales bacterium]